MIYICKLHWNLNTMFVCQVISLWFTYVIFHVLSNLLLIYICKLHWRLFAQFVAIDVVCYKYFSRLKSVLESRAMYVICIFHVLSNLLLIYITKLHWNPRYILSRPLGLIISFNDIIQNFNPACRWKRNGSFVVKILLSVYEIE